MARKREGIVHKVADVAAAPARGAGRIRATVSPKQGAAYAYSGGGKGTWTALALWLFVIAALILAYRNKAVPTQSQFATLGAGALGVVILAAVFPAPVALIGAGIVLSAVANVPGIGHWFTEANAKVAALLNQSS